MMRCKRMICCLPVLSQNNYWDCTGICKVLSDKTEAMQSLKGITGIRIQVSSPHRRSKTMAKNSAIPWVIAIAQVCAALSMSSQTNLISVVSQMQGTLCYSANCKHRGINSCRCLPSALNRGLLLLWRLLRSRTARGSLLGRRLHGLVLVVSLLHAANVGFGDVLVIHNRGRVVLANDTIRLLLHLLRSFLQYSKLVYCLCREFWAQLLIITHFRDHARSGNSLEVLRKEVKLMRCVKDESASVSCKGIPKV